MFPHGRSYQIDYFFGWRYLFSSKFRRRVQLTWNTNPFSRIVCIFGGIFGMVFTGALTLLALMATLHLLSSA